MADNVKVVPCGPVANESERMAIAHLKSSLIGLGRDEDWVLLTNLPLSMTHQRQSDEIDIVVLGPPGVRVIEVKHWTASRVHRDRDHVEHEADRVTNKAKKIGTKLRAKIGNIPRVDGVFLVTEVPAKVEKIAREAIRGVRIHTFKTWREAVGVDSPEVLTSEQIRLAARLLTPRSAVALDGELSRLGGYVRLDLQTDPTQRFHRVYRAKHATRQERVVLHLYDLSASDESNAEDRARREFVALHQLQKYNWAPQIVDSFQDAPDYAGEMAFFTVADPAAPSIAERAEDDTWEPDARTSFSRFAVRALRELHEATSGDEPMVHRNLTPQTVLVRHDNTPILTGFEYARIPTEVTVASTGSNAEWDESVAPEVRASGRSAADRRSDVYSLCASLRVLFAGGDADSQAVAQVLDGGTAQVPSARAELSDLDRDLSGLLGESVPPAPPPPARFWTEDQVVRFTGIDYRIVTRLGSGGVGTTFKVVGIDRDMKEDLGTYVAKVVHNQAAGARVLPAYRMVRSHLHSSGLSMIYEVASHWQENGIAALMQWIEGDSLAGYAGLIGELAEDAHEASDEALALRWVRAVCAALGELHRNGLVHGDVSPHNLILKGSDVVLTDYDCVGKIDAPLAAPGTVKYCSPSYQEKFPATCSDDLYALAASIFSVLFDREPFGYEGVCAKERGLNWDDLPRDQYAELSAFLDRATAPDRGRRYATAADALREIDTVADTTDEDDTTETGRTEPRGTRENEPEAGVGERSLEHPHSVAVAQVVRVAGVRLRGAEAADADRDELNVEANTGRPGFDTESKKSKGSIATADDLILSQASLQDYVECRYRFRLRYLDRLEWPALRAEPAARNERRLRDGKAFHQMVHQYLLGVPAERLQELAEHRTGADGGKEPADWWRAFCQNRPADLPGKRFPEVKLATQVAGRRLSATYDLVVVQDGERAVILDWKTSARRPREATVERGMQTRVYPYLLARAGAVLNEGKALPADRIEMRYWFAAHPRQPVVIRYDHDRFEADGQLIADLVREISELPLDRFDRTERRERCRLCTYRSLCDRGDAAAHGDVDEDGEHDWLSDEDDDEAASFDYADAVEEPF